ncbi:MAG TPA: hypothetical protein VGZ47_17045 [Gemmataceae bacterium]|jgi:hypothetical protein|nr:hypothetical protein [Gemmataceae bacterium]
MTIFYAGTRYFTYMEGAVPKVVKCEECNQQYVYLFHARSTGVAESPYLLNEAGAQQSAQEQASFTLSYELEHGISVVPCPNCGRIQQHMFPLVTKEKYGWIGAIVLSLSVFAALALLAALLGTAKLGGKPSSDMITGVLACWAAFALLLALAVGLHLRKKALCRAYDPNDRPVEERLARGRELALSVEEFERQMKQPRSKSEKSR